MANGLEEEIIIIEDIDAANESSSSEASVTEKSSSKKNKKLIFIALGVGVLLISIITLFIVLKSSKEPILASTQNIEDRLEQPIIEPVELSKIENMIAKADYLYSSGSKNEALSLYEKIAEYSEAVSAYNLGVAQIKEAQYKTALDSFAKAIKNNEQRCVSAINAAVCALHLDDEATFKYYIDLAYAYLPQERSSPLYSYYYTLINYYNQNYLEALSSLNNPTTDEYNIIQNNLSAKINALFENNIKAIDSLENSSSISNDFSLGLLYARVGDLTLAKKYLQNAIKNGIEPMKAQLAIAYINLKSGQIQDGAKEIENATDIFRDEVYKPYPLKVKLKDSLFDSSEAQKHYRNTLNNSKAVTYQKIFYFSPYKIFNANQTISYIRKGNTNIFIDNVDSAKEYLEKSASSSSVNIGIVKAIQKALSFKLREANEMLLSLVEIQPKHSALHYNLALTYAQLGNFVDAQKHFVRSYNLDAKNYISGIYAVMCSQLIDKDSTKLLSIIRDEIANEEFSQEIDLYKTLLYISEDNYLSASDWLEKDYPQRPLYLALEILIALKQNNIDVAQKSANKLTILLPDEILPHLMQIDTLFNTLEEKKYSNEVMNYLKIQKFSFTDLYYGAHITRYLYIQQNLITGNLYFLRERLKEVLAGTTSQTHEITSALALASLYDKAYEESFTLYNNLIDNLKVRDAQTLFLGAVASTAANHHENAIALLELSKMKDNNFLESRYALGLLYLESKNNEGAVIQLSRVYKNNFNSEYFDFNIDEDKLMLQKSLSENKK